MEFIIKNNMAQATIWNPKTGQKRVVTAGDPNAFAGGFELYTGQDQQPQTYSQFIDQAYRNPQYDEASRKYDEALKTLNELTTKEPGYLLKQKTQIESKDPFLQKLNQERSKYIGEQFSAPMTARAKYSDIFDPTKREALVAQAIGNVVGKLSGTQGAIDFRRGTDAEKAQAALEVLQAQIKAATNTANAAGDTKDALGRLLQDIAGKNYAEYRSGVQREQDLEDYKKKLALQKSYNNTKDTTPKVKAITSGTLDYLGRPLDPGLQFSDSEGLPISPIDYANQRGMTIDQVLAGSPNPADVQFTEQYRDISTRAANGQDVSNDYYDLVFNNRHIFGLITDQDVDRYVFGE